MTPHRGSPHNRVPRPAEQSLGSTGAELLAEALGDVGVEVVFGLPGVHNLAAWNAFDAAPGIRLVCVRHEQTAVYAADGYARATGRVGVALVTTGPGAANTLGAVGEAWASRSPVLVIATDIPTELRRPGVVGGALHECSDQAAMFTPVTKAAWRASLASEVGALAARAAAAALAAPARPVLLEVPADLLTAAADKRSDLSSAAPSCAWGEPDLEPAVALAAGARRPLVWVGGGAVASGAGDAVATLAERLDAPVLTTYSARGVVGDHHNAVGLPPHVEEVGALWDDADLVVAIGSDLDGMMTQNWRMPAPPRLIAINADEADAAKNYRPDAVLAGDAARVAAALAEALPARDRTLDLAPLRAAVRARLEREHPAETAFLDAFAAAVPKDAVLLADMCIPGYWLAGFHGVTAPRRLQYPMGWGTLGYAFPASIGAAAATGPVVSVSGDGGFLFACGELATVAQERLGLTTVIVDDGGYGMLRYDQRRSGSAVSYGIDLRTPDHVALAEAFGIRAEQVDGLAADFSGALAHHVADPEPTVLVARAALEPPPTTSPRWYRSGPPVFSPAA